MKPIQTIHHQIRTPALILMLFSTGCVSQKFKCPNFVGQSRVEVLQKVLEIQPNGVVIKAGLPCYNVKNLEQVVNNTEFMTAREWQIQCADSGIIYNYAAYVLLFDPSGNVNSQSYYKTMQP